MQDTVVKFPSLYMEVFIAGDKYEEQAFAQMLVRAECTQAKAPDEADLVIFTGGPDVNPALYGEKPLEGTTFNEGRDKDDEELWKYCVDYGIPMFGVCRGAQFGAVMHGAKLWQDVDNHYGDHSIWDNKHGYLVEKVSSVHHQAVRNDGQMEIIADSHTSSEKVSETSKENNTRDIEAFFYRDVCFLGVQGHPEYRGYTRYAKWCLDRIDEFVVNNPDITLIDNLRRIKPELRVNSEVNATWKELA